ncbi:hypothetical protein C8R44DRAFT_894678 [Mycena epipterygia]|nr:hypothetical protein C8R44DRAFT_894678 [Mycena epipterygia]
MKQSFPVNSFAPLEKGKACVNCRRRKTKCDGDRPICGPCKKDSAAFGDCEYAENGPSSSQMLEEQISILQARIEELEKPKDQRLTLSILQASGSRGYPMSPAQISPSNTMGLGPLLSYFYSQQTSGTSVSHNAANSMPTELPFILLQALVHNFLHNASPFGFFLDTQAFHDAVATTNGRNLPPVLLNVLYLWGVHLSDDARITVYEPAFLAHALRSTASSLTGTHPRTIIHSLQASILLAHYFIRNTRFLEGKYHTSVAVSIAVSAGLHRIRGSQPAALSPTAEALPPAMDALKEGERISAFWNVLTLNNCWAGVDGSPSNVANAPLRGGKSSSLITSSGTVARFLADRPDNATSDPALHAKAGILFERATRLGVRYRASGISHDDPELTALDRKIHAFITALPAIQSKSMLVVHTLAHVATIQLYKPLAKDHSFARRKALAAARSVVDILKNTDVPKIGLIDPVLAPLWTSACLVLITEVSRQRTEAGGDDSRGLTESLNIVIAAMQIFAPHFRLMSAQLDNVRQAYNAAHIGN